MLFVSVLHIWLLYRREFTEREALVLCVQCNTACSVFPAPSIIHLACAPTDTASFLNPSAENDACRIRILVWIALHANCYNFNCFRSRWAILAFSFLLLHQVGVWVSFWVWMDAFWVQLCACYLWVAFLGWTISYPTWYWREPFFGINGSKHDLLTLWDIITSHERYPLFNHTSWGCD